MTEAWTPAERAHEVDVLVRDYGHSREVAEELVDLRMRLEQLEARGWQPPAGSGDGAGGEQQPSAVEEPPAEEPEPPPQGGQQPTPDGAAADLTRQLVEAQQRGDQAEVDRLQAAQRGRLLHDADADGFQPGAAQAAEVPSPDEVRQQLQEAQARGDQAAVDALQNVQRARLFGRI